MQFGIVMFQDKPASGHTAYYKANGVAAASVDLTTSYKYSDTIDAGRATGLQVQCLTAYESTGATGITVTVEGKITDALNPTLVAWAPIVSTRLDTVTTPDQVEHALTSSSLNVLLYVPKQSGIDQIRIGAKATGGTVKTGDKIIVHVNSL